jgi:UDP-N-acetylglucosamine--N-acetylmuramyl-(pentapeptide) pyrophosphoryl-undecaprenol N-acetylglucosamine transferase
MSNLDLIRMSDDVQFIWQTGKFYFDEMNKRLSEQEPVPNLMPTEFVQDMDLAYAAADLVISRAGAGTISELCLLGKPVILVPSPNVAEDHQTKNAMALVDKGAALMVPDADCEHHCLPQVLDLFESSVKREQMSAAIQRLAVRGAADKIVDQIEMIVK